MPSNRWNALLALLPQSALDPAGRDAERIAGLFLWVSAAFAVIWIVVVGFAFYAQRAEPVDERKARRLIVGGGVAFPVVVLSALLLIGLAMLPKLLAAAPESEPISLDIAGQQWWWRVRYVQPGRHPVELANEIRLPVGRRVDLRVTSRDVVHSFWIPSIAGKMDMIPGRTNRISLEPTRTGTFRGQCAEFCGTSHARMSIDVVVMEPAAFEQWLVAQSQPAQTSADADATRGRRTFLARGCHTCHTIRGTPAQGVIGPDLTHVATRLTLAAGTIPTSQQHVRRWISSTHTIKPDALMPPFKDLPASDLDALAAYLMTLR
jgi:cytochrome c oxidase subunit II